MNQRIFLNDVLSRIFDVINIENLSDNASILDLYYFKNHSGQKIISPLVESTLKNIHIHEVVNQFGHSEYRLVGSISEEDRQNLGFIIKLMFGSKWDKLFATLNLQYNPIDNYDMTETESTEGSNTGTVGSEKNDSQTDTTERSYGFGETINRNDQTTNAGNSKVYGFNSSSGANSDSQNANSSLTATETHGGTDTENVTVNRSGSMNDTTTNDLHTASNRTLSRHGNIGVTTSQQMIQQERDLQMWNIYSVIFADLDSVLTTSVY